MKKTHLLISLLALGFINSCQNADEAITETPKQMEIHDKIVNVTKHDGRPFSTGTSAQAKFVAGPGKCSDARVLLGCS